MQYQEDFDITQRYDFLCRASQSNVEQGGQRLQLVAALDVLDKIINHDLPELAYSGSSSHVTDILKALNLELEHFRAFCEFPDLAQKVIVGVGGAFSAGKSSLINTILGKKRLVVEIDPTTSLPTYLLHGDQEQITAINLFHHRVVLSKAEFASLTHEEKIKYGSQISGLLRSAFVSDPYFTWKDVALLDTPGYSKPDSEQWSERTDESVARSQLNLSNYIIWVVSAMQGTISEDDLKFLATLNVDIPKLIVISRADTKTPEDIIQIVELVKQITFERGINVLDVIPVSARKKIDFPSQPIVNYLEKWNEHKQSFSLVQNFQRLFGEYAEFIEEKQSITLIKLNRLNRILTLAELAEIQEDAKELRLVAEADLMSLKNSIKLFKELENKFFTKINTTIKNMDVKSRIKLATVTSDKEIKILLAHDKSTDVKLALLNNNEKSNESGHGFLGSIFGRPGSYLDEEVLLILAQDSELLVRIHVAENKYLTERIKNILLKDSEVSVKIALSKNFNINGIIKKDDAYLKDIFVVDNSGVCRVVSISI